MSYSYAAADPRERPAHYMYSPFEGAAFLSDYLRQRALLADALPAGSAPAVGALAAPPAPIATAATLETCAALAQQDRLADAAAWAEFFLRKIEITRRLRAAYDADGRMRDTRDAGADAYAFAASLFAAFAAPSRSAIRFRWMNACLKSLDVLSAIGAGALSESGAFSARHACRLEASLVRRAAADAGVALP